MTATPDTRASLPTGVRTHHGSCRCGAIRYEVDLDLSQGTTRCNCSICWKTGWWGVLVRPDAFRLLSKDLTPTQRGMRSEAQCSKCGVVAYGHGDVPELGGEFYSINVRCLDDVDLAGVPIRYHDGRHDTWALLSEGTYVDPFVGAGDPTNAPFAPQAT